MDPTADRRRRRLLIAATAGAFALLLLVGVGVYGLILGPRDTSRPPSSSVSASPSPNPTTPGRAEPKPIPVAGTPEQFARNVAAALFTWDTAAGAMPSDYAQMLADVASDREADALAADVRTYLPAAAAWAQLRQYQTRQWLTIDTAAIPDAWDIAVEQAAPGQLPPGAVAYTITGTRHRTGTWGTKPVEASQPVAFTLFLACTPPIPGRGGPGLCELLRLSQLDNPLR